MKYFIAVFLMALAINVTYGQLVCSLSDPEIKVQWKSMKANCTEAMKRQIQVEINASYKYLAMATHFSRDTVNRPGFAEMFFKSAREEREHGAKLIEYLSMRGELAKSVSGLIRAPTLKKHSWATGVDALEYALKMETEVTKAIRDLIITCEQNDNDYHLVDYLTGVYLEEQLHGQREIVGKLSTLKKMMNNHKELGEFLFDKEL